MNEAQWLRIAFFNVITPAHADKSLMESTRIGRRGQNKWLEVN
jgi:hypothetical protein